jgi:hypothetical protein
MPALSKLERTFPAPRTATLGPEQFAATWPARPKDEVLVGLRLPSPNDKIFVQVEAAKRAKALGGEDERLRTEIERDARVRLLVARCLCDPNDADAASSALPFAEDSVFDALTDAAARFLFDRILDLQVETAQGEDGSIEDVAKLMELLAAGALETLSEARYQTVLRYLSFSLSVIEDELSEAQASGDR